MIKERDYFIIIFLTIKILIYKHNFKKRLLMGSFGNCKTTICSFVLFVNLAYLTTII